MITKAITGGDLRVPEGAEQGEGLDKWCRASRATPSPRVRRRVANPRPREVASPPSVGPS